jgi:hypothetical protein
MSTAVAMPQKRILSDTTSNSRNVMPPSPNASKKRKLLTDEPITNINVPARNNGPKAFGSSQTQQKSQFEEVLERLSQDISGLKQKNSEKDQQWDRPPLEDFDENRDILCFQQIDVSEGTLEGGKATIKLFGVTEVLLYLLCFLIFHSSLGGCYLQAPLLKLSVRTVIQFFSMSPDSSITSISLHPSTLPKQTVVLT